MSQRNGASGHRFAFRGTDSVNGFSLDCYQETIGDIMPKISSKYDAILYRFFTPIFMLYYHTLISASANEMRTLDTR
jgi:hypothetical protein